MMRVAPWALVPLILAGCSGSTPQARADVVAHEARFDPRTFEVAAGKPVLWRVEGSAHHTVTVADPDGGPGQTLGDSGDLGSGDTYSFTFSHSGTFQVYCRYHSQGAQGVFDESAMVMKVQVT